MKIEKGIQPKKKYKYPFSDMEVSDSFNAGEYSTELHRNMGSISAYYHKKLGFTYSSMKMEEKGKWILRVFRVA